MAKDKIAKTFLAITKDKFTIDTIAEMIATKHLAEGDIVRLNGYYSAGDGADHIRKISKTNDGSGVQLANGLYANIVHSGEVNVSWFGAKGDGINDDTLAIQKALDIGKDIILEKEFYLIKESLFLHAYKTLKSYTKSCIKTELDMTPIKITLFTTLEGVMFSVPKEFKSKVIDFRTDYYNRSDEVSLGNEIFEGPDILFRNSFRIKDCYIQKRTNGGRGTPYDKSDLGGVAISVYSDDTVEKDFCMVWGSVVEGCKIVGGFDRGFDYYNKPNSNAWNHDSSILKNRLQGVVVPFHIENINLLNLEHNLIQPRSFISDKSLYCMPSIIKNSSRININRNSFWDTGYQKDIRALMFYGICDDVNFDDFYHYWNDANYTTSSRFYIENERTLDGFNYTLNKKKMYVEGQTARLSVNTSSALTNILPNKYVDSKNTFQSIPIYGETNSVIKLGYFKKSSEASFYNPDYSLDLVLFESKSSDVSVQQERNNIYGTTNFYWSTSENKLKSRISLMSTSENYEKFPTYYYEEVGDKIFLYQEATLTTTMYTHIRCLNFISFGLFYTVRDTKNYLSIKDSLTIVQKDTYNGLSGTYTSHITTKHIGMQFFRTDLKRPVYWDGASWVDILSPSISSLDTPYHASNMQKLGILDSYHNYLTELHEYEKSQNVQSDSEIMNLNILQPPAIPVGVEEYAKEYNLI